MAHDKKGLDRLLKVFKKCVITCPDKIATLIINPDRSFIIGFDEVRK